MNESGAASTQACDEDRPFDGLLVRSATRNQRFPGSFGANAKGHMQTVGQVFSESWPLQPALHLQAARSSTQNQPVSCSALHSHPCAFDKGWIENAEKE